MGKDQWVRGRVLAAGLVLVALATLSTGCGVVIAGAAGGILFAVSGGGKSRTQTQNQATAVPTAQVKGDTSGGSVTLEFTLADPESDASKVEVRYSLDPNEPATSKFAKVATGKLQTPAGGPVDASAVPTSSSGIVYDFVWNTAQDLGATLNQTVREQIVIDGAVAFTTPSFTVDNTGVPLVVSAAPGALPGGASVYADAQSSPGIPIAFTVAQAQSTPVAVKVLYSTDGGRTFPDSNVAAGQIMDGSGRSISSSAVPTSPAGIAYTFRFASTSNGLGSSGASTVVLRFTAADTKTSAPVDTTSFQVNDTPVAGSVDTPAVAAVRDKVFLRFVVQDAAAEDLDVDFEFSASGGGGPFFPATAVSEAPALQGTQNLRSSSFGVPYHFVWNAAADFARHSITATDHVVVAMFVTRPSTQVRTGPFETSLFSVDQRLMESALGRAPLDLDVVDGIPATQAILSSPQGVTAAGGKVYFADTNAGRVRAVDLAKGTIDTVLGAGTSGEDSSEGTPALDYYIASVQGVAASNVGVTTLFASISTIDFTSNIFVDRVVRVDGLTGATTTLIPLGSGAPAAIAYEPLKDHVFAVDGAVIEETPAAGGGVTTVIGGGSQDPTAGPVPLLQASISPGTGLAANWNAFPDIVFVSQSVGGTLLAANLNPTVNHVVFGTNVPAGQIVSLGSFSDPEGLSIGLDAANQPVLYVAQAFPSHVTMVDAQGNAAIVAGSASGEFGFAGDGGPATLALMGDPTWVAAVGPGSFAVSDVSFPTVRLVSRTGTIATIAGSQQSGDVGLGRPAAIATISTGLNAGFSVVPSATGLLVTDARVNGVRAIDGATTIFSSFAGNGASGVSGDGKSALSAGIGTPLGLAVSGTDVYIAQPLDHVVRRVSGGVVQTVAGVAEQFTNDGIIVDGTAATQQKLAAPTTLAMAGQCVVIGQAVGEVLAVNVGAVTTTCCGVAVNPGEVVHIAGGGGTTPASGIQAVQAQLTNPAAVCADQAGSVYFADNNLAFVGKVDASTGALTVVCGKPGTSWQAPNPNGDGGLATAALMNGPTGVCLEEPRERVLYFLDANDNEKVRAVNVSASTVQVQGVSIAPGNVATVAGGGAGFAGAGDGGPATSAAFTLGTNTAFAVNFCTDASGNLYVPDEGAGHVRLVDPLGLVRTYCGLAVRDGDRRPADNAKLTFATALAALPDGSYAVCDLGRIRLVDATSTIVRRIAGTAQQTTAGDGGAALDASFAFQPPPAPGFSNNQTLDGNGPRQIAFSGSTFAQPLLAIADTRAHSVRLVNLGSTPFVQSALGLSLAPGAITRLVGAVATQNGVVVPASGFAGDGALASGMATSGAMTTLSGPEGVAFTSSGLLVFADTGNKAVRAVNLSSAPVTVGATTIPSGFVQTIVGSVTAPRNLAYVPQGGLLAFEDGAAGATEISVVDLNPGPVDAYGVTLGPGSPQTVASGSGAGDLRGCACDPTTGDLLFCMPSANIVESVRFADGSVLVAAGTGTAAVPPRLGDGLPPTSAQLNAPFAVAVDGFGTYFILDANNRVRRCRRFP